MKLFIKVLNDSMKDCVKEFILMMDEMLDKYCEEDEWLVFDSVGIKKKDYYNMYFTKDNYIRALNFYLKEKSKAKKEINIEGDKLWH